VNVRGFGVLRGAIFASAPFIAMAVFCPLGGWATDYLTVRRGRPAGRSWPGGSGMILAGVCIVAGAFTEHAFLAIALLSLGAALPVRSRRFTLPPTLKRKRANAVSAPLDKIEVRK
jgi:ACS family glucarate transporter-like MFS transporter